MDAGGEGEAAKSVLFAAEEEDGLVELPSRNQPQT